MKPNYLKELRGPIAIVVIGLLLAIRAAFFGGGVTFGQGAYPGPGDPKVRFSQSLYESPAGATITQIQVIASPVLPAHFQVSIFGATNPEIIADLLAGAETSTFDVPVPPAGGEPTVIYLENLHPLNPGPGMQAFLVSPEIAIILPAGETVATMKPMVRFENPPNTASTAGSPYIINGRSDTDFKFYAIGSKITTTITRNGVVVFGPSIQHPANPISIITPLCVFPGVGAACGEWSPMIETTPGTYRLSVTAEQPDGESVTKSVDLLINFTSKPEAFLPLVQGP